ncbi:uncharacterized protein I303_104110 [Kwoniella dejecticola CBS 10117]|uniref:NADP-dependent oxidoreductase domain-containing protein n=1 Tax=Kwoniella dejecticola CBS 10117 TaxID=1296121 RepID=A0A1A6A699_9TREE|nr:uncharacterized protein I303_04911 [Kwoniella dejecticola CBS 10117]OBR85575.1 hypothetical protein I303_04911 [Kwoniella dejecticola CBS 10117]
MTGSITPDGTITLSSGVKIPQLGFGVYQSPPEVTSKTVLAALDAGYKHIDSAYWYFNEEQVGSAIKDSKYPRQSIFITTKLGLADGITGLLDDSVAKIDPTPEGYVDLFLIHSPSAGPEKRKEQWKALEDLVKSGKAKTIGVSNYGVKHLEQMEEYAVTPPAVNQIELHPWCQQPSIVAYCQSHNIALEAYSPLVQGTKAQDPTLTRIAEETGKSWAQVLIRWSLQRGFIPLPKSDTKERIIANRDVFDFELSDAQMQALNALDKDEHVCLNHTELP